MRAAYKAPSKEIKHQLKTKKETKIESLIQTVISNVMETLLHEKHLFSSTSAARTAALPQTLTFWLAHRWAQKGMLMVHLVRVHRKEGTSSYVPCFKKLRKSFQLSEFARALGLWPFSGWGVFLSYGLAFHNVKGQKVLTDTQQTPERLITQPVSSPLSASLEHLPRVFKFDLQMLIVFLCTLDCSSSRLLRALSIYAMLAPIMVNKGWYNSVTNLCFQPCPEFKLN